MHLLKARGRVLSPGNGGDPSRHAEGGGFPSDGGGAGPGRLLLRLQQPGRPGAPEGQHRRPGRAVVAAAGPPGGESCYYRPPNLPLAAPS